MKKNIFAGIFLLVFAAFSQNTPRNTIVYVPTAPSGSCPNASATLQYVTTTGVLYGCVSGTWTNVSGGGPGAGTVTSVTGTANQISVASGTTTPVLSFPAGGLTLPGTTSFVNTSSSLGAVTGDVLTSPVTPSVVTVGSQVNVGAVTTITLTPPASIVNGNVLVAVISIMGQSAETWTPPSGWTQIGSNVSSGAATKLLTAVFGKVAASESGNYVWSWNNASVLRATGVILQLTGTSLTTDGIGTATGNAQTVTVSATSTTKANDLLLLVGQGKYDTATTRPVVPVNWTQQVATQGMFIGTLPNGYGAAPATTYAAYSVAVPNTGVTNDLVGMVIAFSGSTVSSIPVSSPSGPSSQSSYTISGGAGFGGVVGANQFVIPNAVVASSPANSYALTLASGAIVPGIGINSGNSICIDCGKNTPIVQIGNGIHGGPFLLIGSGNIQWVSQADTQDLILMATDASNNLLLGNANTAGSSEQNDTYYRVQTGKTHHFSVNGSDVLTLSSTALTQLSGAADFSAASSFKLRVAAGLTAATNGFLGYDSTNNMLHAAQSSADAFVPQFTVTPTNAHCVTWVVSGSNYKLGDAACSSGGTVTVVSSGSLGSTQIMTGGGSQASQTPSSAATLDSSGNMVVNSISTGSATNNCDGTSGCVQLGQGTAPSGQGTTAIQLVAPTSVTSYRLVAPSASATGFLLGTDSSNINTLSFVGFSGTSTVARTTSPTFVTPILGTPTSVTLTNATGLPVAGLSNLGTNVGAFLVAPSGANFNSMIAAGGVPIAQSSKSAAYTTVLADGGTQILHPTADNNARTFTIDSNVNVAYPVGTTITFVNQINTLTIAITSDTLQLAGSATTGSRTIAAGGMGTAIKVTSTLWFISGPGVT